MTDDTGAPPLARGDVPGAKLRAWHSARSTASTSSRTLVGEHLGYSDWVEITQERVNAFADATGDHQWIHVDVERAKQGPSAGRSPTAT